MIHRIHVVLCGANGKMGRAIASLAREDPNLSLVEITRQNASEMSRALEGADVLIDFSSPESSLGFIAQAAQRQVAAVVGTTGFTPSQTKRLKTFSRKIPLFISPNMSLGMNVLIHLAGRAATALEGYDAAISETHHAQKKDAPSGSALRLAESIRQVRKNAPIPIASLRAGDIVGQHTLLLAGPGESLELTHRAHSREVFARGALKAALWLRSRKPGLYTMKDFLGF